MKLHRRTLVRAAGVGAIIAVLGSVMLSYELGWPELTILAAIAAGLITFLLKRA